jgi:hypothetical protein
VKNICSFFLSYFLCAHYLGFEFVIIFAGVFFLVGLRCLVSLLCNAYLVNNLVDIFRKKIVDMDLIMQCIYKYMCTSYDEKTFSCGGNFSVVIMLIKRCFVGG